MKKLLWIVPAAALLTAGLAQNAKTPFLGRWDVTVTAGRDTYPDWIEVTEKSGKLAALIQPRAGGAGWAADVKPDGNRLTVTLRGGRGPATLWELTDNGNAFTGDIKRGDAVRGQLAGVRAPALNRPMPKAWSDPEPIFDGKDLNGWEPFGAANHWVARDGELINEAKGANIRTTRKFNDFKLHIEYNCPDDGNSGIYLRGRYEVQVEYEAVNANDRFHKMGSIYSFLAPSVDLPRKPGTWETYDITLVGRHVTVVRDGVKTIDNQEIPGITGGALDSHEGEPGPFYIQGDHTGGMKYRNIRVSVPK
jgi:3-keto-disaccharide hydrolase